MPKARLKNGFFGLSGVGCKVKGLGFWSFGFGVLGLRGLEFRVYGLGFRIWASGFWDLRRFCV